jgi:hypothetical protein
MLSLPFHKMHWCIMCTLSWPWNLKKKTSSEWKESDICVYGGCLSPMSLQFDICLTRYTCVYGGGVNEKPSHQYCCWLLAFTVKQAVHFVATWLFGSRKQACCTKLLCMADKAKMSRLTWTVCWLHALKTRIDNPK